MLLIMGFKTGKSSRTLQLRIIYASGVSDGKMTQQTFVHI